MMMRFATFAHFSAALFAAASPILIGTVGWAQAGNEPDPIDQVMGEAWQSPGIPPPRAQLGDMRTASSMSANELWLLVQRFSPRQRRFLIVLKNEGQNRGYFRGSNLMSTGEFENAKAEILRSIRGIRQDPELGSGIRLANGTQLPSFYAAIDSLDALTKLRLWRTLDYVEPAFMFFDSIACGADVYVQSSDPRAEDKTVPGLGGGTDLVPYVYQFHGVQPAWARFNLPGQEQGVAVLDSGVSTQQEQFFSRYAMFNARRPHLRLKEVSANQSIDDVCFHGTKVASVAAAPRDGRSIVGIAWDAPLITAKINESPLATQGSVNAICAGIMDAVKPPDGRPPARAVAMAFGLSYASDTVAECIRTAFQTSPSTVFVAAAGSNVPRVVFPANMDGFVQAVSTVELSPSGSGFRLFGRPLTVAYGPEVDFVTVNGPDGMPASGVIGNNQADQIARFKWSSAATGMYAGLVALAGQYASQRNWTRAQLISAMQQAASRNGITDFSGEPLEGAMVGWGILDVYRATGGAQIATISGVYQATGGQKVTLIGSTDAVQPFGAMPPPHMSFSWMVNGTPAGTGQTVTLTAPSSGVMNVQLTVHDQVDQKVLVATHSVQIVQAVQPPIFLRVYSSSYVADWATFFNGGRHDRLINVGEKMPQACIVQNVQGLLLCESNGTVGVCAGEVPQKSADRKTHGFTISRVAGISSNGLDVNIHQWHDGLSAVRTKAVYDIIQPAGVNCVVPNVLSATP